MKQLVSSISRVFCVTINKGLNLLSKIKNKVYVLINFIRIAPNGSYSCFSTLKSKLVAGATDCDWGAEKYRISGIHSGRNNHHTSDSFFSVVLRDLYLPMMLYQEDLSY